MNVTKLFGTDGIRGIVNKELNCDLVFKIGMALSKIIKQKFNNFKILIGKDTRNSCDMLECALSAGICACGGNVVSVGIVPTPAVAFLTEKLNFNAGIMISASHNSYEFNGIKIFDSHGYKLSETLEQQIEQIIFNSDFDNINNNIIVGQVSKQENLINYYIDNLLNTVNINKKNKFKILIDCANGSACATVEKIFTKLSPNILCDFINNIHDGLNINKNCGSTCVQNLVNLIKEKNYDIGFAFDGDADRCLAVDELGNIIDGDTILGICAQNFKKNNKLSSNTIVGTVMSNLGLKKFCEENNINFVETQVGDKYVLDKILNNNYNFGGEQSGHIIFKDHSNTGDGQLTALQLLNIIVNSGKKTSEFNNIVKKYPQILYNININLTQKNLLNQNQYLKDCIENIKKTIGTDGRILVRESGTEPKIRIMIEHKDKSKLNIFLNEIKALLENFYSVKV